MLVLAGDRESWALVSLTCRFGWVSAGMSRDTLPTVRIASLPILISVLSRSLAFQGNLSSVAEFELSVRVSSSVSDRGNTELDIKESRVTPHPLPLSVPPPQGIDDVMGHVKPLIQRKLFVKRVNGWAMARSGSKLIAGVERAYRGDPASGHLHRGNICHVDKLRLR